MKRYFKCTVDSNLKTKKKKKKYLDKSVASKTRFRSHVLKQPFQEIKSAKREKLMISVLWPFCITTKMCIVSLSSVLYKGHVHHSALQLYDVQTALSFIHLI